MSRLQFKPSRYRTPPVTCWGAARWCYSVVSLVSMISLAAIFLYVFPPWKIKAVAELAWDAGSTVFHVARKVSFEEQKAQKFLAQMAKSGRDLWSSVQDEVTDVVGSGVKPEPKITLL